jgi:hypothetical protein
VLRTADDPQRFPRLHNPFQVDLMPRCRSGSSCGFFAPKPLFLPLDFPPYFSYGSEINLRGKSALCSLSRVVADEPTLLMAMALSSRMEQLSLANSGQVGGRLLTPPAHDLVHPLFRDAVCPGDADPCFTRFVMVDNLGISVSLSHMIRLRRIWIWRVIQHLDDMKRGQPSVEASRVFAAPTRPVSALIITPSFIP